MIYKTIPENFNSKFEVAGCFVMCDGEIILLRRQNHKQQGGTWGVPAGKRDKGESLVETACRETKEETGLFIPQNEMKFFSTVYVRYDEFDFVFHIFYTNLNNKAEIKINETEHTEARWISLKEALRFPLLKDEDACIQLFFGAEL